MAELKSIEEIMENVKQLPRHRQEELMERIKNSITSNHRSHERRPVNIPIKLVAHEEICRPPTRDISSGGAFVDTDDSTEFQVFQPVSLAFNLSTSPRAFKIKGRVVRVEERGIAIQFHQDIPDDFSGCIDREIRQA